MIIWIRTEKDITTAVLLTLFLGVVGVLDNALNPLVMGRDLTMPTLVILSGDIGGALAHGVVGLFRPNRSVAVMAIGGGLDPNRWCRFGGGSHCRALT